MSHIWPRSLSAIALLLVPTAGYATEACEPFSVVAPNEGRLIEFVDHGTVGVSPGDFRVGNGPLLDQDGAVVGEIDWIATVVHPGDDGNARLISEGALRFSTGDVLYRTLPAGTVRDADVTHLSTMSTEATRMITGGTGVFAGASGDLAWTRDDNDDIMFDVNISCD